MATLPPKKDQPYKIKRVTVDWPVNTFRKVVDFPEEMTLWRIQNLSNAAIDWADGRTPPETGDGAPSTLEGKAVEIPPIKLKELWVRRTSGATPTIVIIHTTSKAIEDLIKAALMAPTTAKDKGEDITMTRTATVGAANLSLTVDPSADADGAGGAYDLINIMVLLSAAFTGDLTVTLDSVHGAAYDVVLKTDTLTAATSWVVDWGEGRPFEDGDQIVLSSSANLNATYGALIKIRKKV